MNKLECITAYALLALMAIFAPLAVAEENEEDAGHFDGEFRIGYRSVDTGGSADKFREDLDLEDGARLFALSFDLETAAGLRHIVDRVQLDLTNLGGDPYESMRLKIENDGHYDLVVRRTVSDYFYSDILQTSTPGVSVHDFHTFDFQRIRDTASLGVQLSQRAKLDVGFERFTKRGESTTSLDIQRDEFELDRPIEESYDDLRVALSYAWPKTTLVLEERVRMYDNAVELFLPGQSGGEDPTDPAVLDFFFLDQPYELESLQHTARINARPTDRLLVQVAASLQSMDLEADADESSQGTTFTGQPFTTDSTGGGDIEHDSDLVDVDISYLITDRIALVGGVRRHHFDQSGFFDFDGDRSSSDWDITSTGAQVGLELHLTPRLTVGGGVRLETRDVETTVRPAGEDASAEEEETEHTGFYANAAWRPVKALRLELEVEDSSYDDPFTLSAPTDRQRLRLRGRYSWSGGYYVQGSYLAYRFDNDLSGWQADRDHLEARLGWRRDDLDIAFAYARIEIERAIDQEVTTAPGFNGGITFLFPIFYSADADFFNGRLRWRAGDRWTVGSDLRLYQNDGSFPLERLDLRAYVEHHFPAGYLLHVGYRTIDYDEDGLNLDDYDADILELSVGYRW